MDGSQGSSTRSATFSRAEGTIDGGSATPLWAHKAGEVSSGYCTLTRQVWVHSHAQWLPIDFLEDEARRDLALHERVLAMDFEKFGAQSVGFFKRANQWMVQRPSSQLNAPSPSPQSADMSRHVFAVDTEDGERTLATLSKAEEKMARGPHAHLRADLCHATSHPDGEPATSHFGASDRRLGGSVFRPFWSKSARPGSQLRAPPMRGPSP